MREELLNEIREQVVAQLIERSPWITEDEIEGEALAFRDWASGYGPFTQIIENEQFTDLFINGSQSAWINRGAGLEPYALFTSEQTLINYIRAQALKSGKLFDQGHASVDLELGSGIRLHALLPPLIEGGIHISLRINQQQAVIQKDVQLERLIELLINERKNILISGGTGSGKTTLLSYLIEQVAINERILVIEDTHEITASHPHLLRLQGREANSEGIGAISIRQLIRQALRMKPDRIFLGEVRGADVLDLFLALNTGHAGSGATIHANSPRDIPNRIAALAMTAGITRESALALFASAIDLIIHLDGGLTGNRIASISEVIADHDHIEIVEISP